MCYYFLTQLLCESVQKEMFQLLPESAKIIISAAAFSGMILIPLPKKWTAIDHTSGQYMLDILLTVTSETLVDKKIIEYRRKRNPN